jgi:hypothetical protein
MGTSSLVTDFFLAQEGLKAFSQVSRQTTILLDIDFDRNDGRHGKIQPLSSDPFVLGGNIYIG